MQLLHVGWHPLWHSVCIYVARRHRTWRIALADKDAYGSPRTDLVTARASVARVVARTFRKSFHTLAGGRIYGRFQSSSLHGFGCFGAAKEWHDARRDRSRRIALGRPVCRSTDQEAAGRSAGGTSAGVARAKLSFGGLRSFGRIVPEDE